MVKNFLKTFWSIIEEYFATRYEIVPIVAEEKVEEATIIVENKATVKNFCLAIQSREGYIAPCKKYPKGTSSWRNNNPGNIKGLDGKFLKFNTYEEGFAYLKYYVRRVMEGKHKAYIKNPTIMQFFLVYAPEGDNNDPTSYASEVANKLGVTTSFLIKDLVL